MAKLDAAWPFGTRCRDHYSSGGTDTNVTAINATGPKVAAVIQGIHARAPRARVLVVGYPDGLPVNGGGCWPLVPFSSGDVSYFNSLETRLNAVISAVSQTNGATYVDTFASSIGHDACPGAGHGVGQRNHPDLSRLSAAPQSGGRDEHGDPGARTPVLTTMSATRFPISAKDEHGT